MIEIADKEEIKRILRQMKLLSDSIATNKKNNEDTKKDAVQISAACIYLIRIMGIDVEEE